MIAEAFAWHYKQYSKDKALAEAEQKTQAGKLGLRADADPVPPWEYRKKGKQ